MPDKLKKNFKEKKGFKVKVGAYSESSRTSVIDLFCENT